MKQSGFTLVEMLTVFTILGIIGAISVSAYSLIAQNTRQAMYENKVKLILTAAENFAEETSFEVVNVAKLIEEGKLEADNEAGDYQNPVTEESMLCNVVEMKYDNYQYQANMTGEQNCSFDDLMLQSSIITLKKYKEDGTELHDEWYRGNVLLKVLFLQSEYEEKALSIQIKGNGQEYEATLNKNFSSKNSLMVSVNQLVQADYEARVLVDMGDYKKEYKAVTRVKIDKQRPMIYADDINVGSENEWLNQDKKITFTMSDGSGSGIYGYTVSTNPQCGSVGPTKTSKQTISISKPNGTYYICVRDNVGNWSEDISTKSVTVSKVDVTPPQIDETSGFTITSVTPNYHHYQTKLHIVATDESPMSMYLSNTGFEQDGEWEAYVADKEWNVAGTLDGLDHYVYLTLRDEAGNKVNVRSQVYRVYSECSVTRKEFTSSFGNCSVTCGGGIKTRSYEIRDFYTSLVCSSGVEEEVCNTQSCDIILFDGTSSSKQWDAVYPIDSVNKDNYCSYHVGTTLDMYLNRSLDSTGNLKLFTTDLIDISSKSRLVIDYTVSSARSGGTAFYLEFYTKDNYPKVISTASCSRSSNQLKTSCDIPGHDSFRCTDNGVNQSTGECSTCCYFTSASRYQQVEIARLSSGHDHDDVINQSFSGTAVIDLAPYREQNEGLYYLGIRGEVYHIDEGNAGNSSLTIRKAVIY